jgi:glucosylceramidase
MPESLRGRLRIAPASIFAVLATAIALASLLAALAPAAARAADESVRVWLTRTSGTSLVSPMSQGASLRFGAPSATSPVISVDAAATFQTIDGLGGTLTDSAAWLIHTSPRRSAIMRDLFASSGASYSMLRLPMGASDASRSNYSYDDTCCDLSDFSVAHDTAYVIPILRQARSLNPRLKVLAAPWSAPGWMKFGGTFTGNCDTYLNYLRNDAYSMYADYFARFVTAYSVTHGVPIHAVSMQNEPRHCSSTYATMNMEPADQSNFALSLRSALNAAGHGAVKIIAWDHNWYEGGQPTGYPQAVLAHNNGQADAAIAGAAYHCYDSPSDGWWVQSAFHDAHPSKEVHFTDCAGGAWATDAASNLVWALQNNLIGPLRNWSRSSLYWSVALDPQSGPYVGGCTNCRGMITVDNASGTYTKNGEYYVWAHLAKVVQPGAVRIGSPDLGPGSIQTVAFRNPDGSLALVALNASGTSTTRFRVAWAGQAFDYTLPARSVASFKWTPSTG